MKKNRLRIIALILSTVLIVNIAGFLSGCDKKAVVTFEYNYAGSPAAIKQNVKIGGRAVKPVNPERAGFEFEGWFTDAEGTEAYTFSEVNGDITVYAKWTALYTITFSLNYTGAPAFDAVVVKDGNKVSKPNSDPSRGGHNFSGWFEETECATNFRFEDTVITSDRTIYAGWEDETKTYFTVTFNYNYEGAPTPGTQSVESGKEAIKPSDPVWGGGEFIKWCTDSDGNNVYNFNSKVNSPVTLYASWRVIHTFAASLTNVGNLSGVGYSGNPLGKACIFKGDDAVNSITGSYIGYTFRAGFSIVFEFRSDVASTGTLAVSLGGELVGDIFEISTDVFEIKVNGTVLAFNSFNLPFRASNSDLVKFILSNIGEIDILEGPNEITLTILANEWYNGGTGGPDIDCIRITTAAKLSWEPELDNLED